MILPASCGQAPKLGSSFKPVPAETATVSVATPAMVLALDIIKHRRPQYFPADKAFAVDAFHL